MIIFSIVTMIAFAIFLAEMAFCIVRIGKGRPSFRGDHVLFRIKHAICAAFGQSRVRERWQGWFHAVIFYAFIVFLSGSIELFAQCIWPQWDWSHALGDGLAQINLALQTYFAWAGLGAVAVLSLRRAICRRSVFQSADAWLILLCIGLILVSHIVALSCLMHVRRDMACADYLPLTHLLSQAWGSHAEAARRIAAGVHLLCLSFFLIWIPRGKHLHIFLAFPALYSQYRAYDDEGNALLGAETPDLDAYETSIEAAAEADLPESEWPSYGAVRLRDATRKMRLESMACAQCLRCLRVCPMTAASPADANGPFASVLSLRKLCMAREFASETLLVGSIVSGTELFACTQCGACDRACPVGAEHASRIIALRRGAMTHDGLVRALPAECHKLFRAFETSGNPWGYPRSKRMEWAQDIACGELDGACPNGAADSAFEDQSCGGADATCADNSVKPRPISIFARMRHDFDVLSAKRILIFGGCFAAYDAGARKSLVRAAAWLSSQGYDVARLRREACCGEPLRKLGNEPAYVACMKENWHAIRNTPHDVILTMCPHCAQTLAQVYARPGRRLRAMHILTFLSLLFERDALSIDCRLIADSDLMHAVMHMPCGLSKTADPRGIIRFLTALGVHFIDSDTARSHCCGGGGGQFFIRGDNPIGLMRARELRAGGAHSVASACPYCIELLRDSLSKVTPDRCGAPDKTGGQEVNSLIGVTNVVDSVLAVTSLKQAP